jgi:hypothetical protein
MDIGVFIPIANDLCINSEMSPQDMPTFELNRDKRIRPLIAWRQDRLAA